MFIQEIQAALQQEHLDGWLFFDHHQRDPLAYRILKLNPTRVATRRWYYFIPAHGEPRGLVHAIESGVLTGLPGDISKYSSWSAQVDGLYRLLAGSRKIASPGHIGSQSLPSRSRGTRTSLAVMSSPCVPSPRVAPVVKTPFS